MALAAGVRIANCRKDLTYTLYLENVDNECTKVKRGNPVGTGKPVCKYAPQKDRQNLSPDWQAPYIDLSIEVKKQKEEVEDPRDGIVISCNESNCSWFRAKER